jgi:two-component system sensor histidine kinase KdpD
LKPNRRRDVIGWLLWTSLLVLVTVLMVTMRDRIDQAHVILVYLLVVLGASASGGRIVGIPLACLGFLAIDLYFQPPYGKLADGKAVDFVALTAFLVTAFVATDLLARAQSEAEEARRRAVEIASLARLGSETIQAGRAEDALARIASVIQTTLNMSECSIVAWDATRDASGLASPTPTGIPAEGAPTRRIVMPLSVQGRVVGVLTVASNVAVKLDASQRRFLDAISYYAALAADRVRLVTEAEHAEALREANRLKDVVLASVSHDLRTPLTTIKALAQTEALRGNGSAAAIEEQADRLSRLVSDLLDLSRLKGGGFAVVPELNTAEDLIGAAVRQTRGLFEQRSLRTVIDLSSPALVGYFDFSQSLRVVCNLLENAVRYSPDSHPIELAARRDNGTLVFSVSDRGPGVNADDVSRIFEPFYRATNGAPDAGRAGLGLSIARTLAEMQGGSVSYTPRSGGGSVFALSLPATELRADALEPAS